MIRRGRALVLGIFAGIVTLAAAGWAASMQIDEQLLNASKPARIVPIPRDLLPQGTPVPVVQPPLTAGQKRRLHAALWRDPLDATLVNILYVDAVRTRGSGAATLPIAQTLGLLGWRHTFAQQNLMLRAALDERFGEVIDRVDGLLRRQKSTDQAISMLVAMETLPQIHKAVVAKLLGRPMWRYEYLVRVGPQAPAQFLDARLATLRVLLNSTGGLSRPELAPSLQALVANGRGRAAYALWERKAGVVRDNNLLRDANFQAAAALTGDETLIPFEWRLNQGLGYSADANGQGISINWDGRGVPVFLTQLLPVDAGYSYFLTVEGRADSGELQDMLAPTLLCGQVTIPFVATKAGDGRAAFKSAPVPDDCDMATFAIGGNVDSGARAVTMEINRATLQHAG
jgi:hypothetical protein